MKRIINNNNQKRVRQYLRKNQTDEENILWQELRGKKLGFKFKRQVSVNQFITDFFCAEKLLAIEIDGGQHQENKEYDIERENEFKKLNIKTLRFWNYEVTKNLESVLKKIRESLHPPMSRGGSTTTVS